jgi:hypothetical protein
MRPDLKHLTVAGDFRRGCELVADLTLVAEAAKEEDAPASLNSPGRRPTSPTESISGPRCCTRPDRLNTSISCGRSPNTRA